MFRSSGVVCSIFADQTSLTRANIPGYSHPGGFLWQPGFSESGFRLES